MNVYFPCIRFGTSVADWLSPLGALDASENIAVLMQRRLVSRGTVQPKKAHLNFAYRRDMVVVTHRVYVLPVLINDLKVWALVPEYAHRR